MTNNTAVRLPVQLQRDVTPGQRPAVAELLRIFGSGDVARESHYFAGHDPSKMSATRTFEGPAVLSLPSRLVRRHRPPSSSDPTCVGGARLPWLLIDPEETSEWLDVICIVHDAAGWRVVPVDVETDEEDEGLLWLHLDADRESGLFDAMQRTWGEERWVGRRMGLGVLLAVAFDIAAASSKPSAASGS